MKDRFVLDIFILLVGAVTTTFFLFFFRYNSTAQLITSLLGCIYYVVWGIMHHAARDRLSALIVLEYILVGGLIFFLLATAFTI